MELAQTLREYYYRFRDGGLESTYSVSEKLAIQYSNLIHGLCILAATDYCIKALRADDRELALIHLFSWIGYVGGNLVMRFWSPKWGNLVVYFALCGSVFFDVDATGIAKNFHLYFLTAAVLPFVMFTDKNWPSIVLCSSLAVAGWFFSFQSEYHLFTSESVNRDYVSSWIPLITVPVALTVLLWLSFRGMSQMVKVNQEQTLQLAQASKLAAIGELAGGVAHEINNPLAVIKGRVAQIKRIFQANGDFKEKAKVLDLIQSIDESTSRASEIVIGLQSFAGKEVKQGESVALRDLCLDVIEAFGERMRGSQVRLKLQEIPDFQVNGARLDLELALKCIVENALEAVLLQNTKWIELAFKRREARVEIHITDSGSGIAENIRDKIMQPFFTSKPVQKRGMGLSVAKGLIESNGGQLLLDVNAPHTCFVVELKLAAGDVR